MTTFTELGLAAPILKALETEGYTDPTPIQAQAIPPVLEGKDLLGIAQTGTGKTAAFALPIIHRLVSNRRPAPRRGCRVLVLSPTRELATQIADSFRAYGRHADISVAVVFGGVAHRPQIQALSRGIDVLVATPGRLLDHMGERNADISGTEILVLDEADQMLDLGFIKPIRRILASLSARRQTLLFSATMPQEISGLARELLNEPVRVAVTPVATTAERVSQRVIHVSTSAKRDLLAELLADASMSRTLVFTRTKRGADRVAKHLEASGISSSAIHGNKSQRQREEALESFKRAEIKALVATDIAARGIDISDVTHVINFELPEVPEAYVHRIGRTARAGASGSAISFCDGEERDLLRRIEKLIRQSIPAESRGGGSVEAFSGDERGSRGRGGRGGRPERGRRHEHRERSEGGDRPRSSEQRERPERRERSEWRGRDSGPRHQERDARPARAERTEGGVFNDGTHKPGFLDRPARPAGENRGPRPERRDSEGRSERPHHAGRPDHRFGGGRTEQRGGDGTGGERPHGQHRGHGNGGPKGPRQGSGHRQHGDARRGEGGHREHRGGGDRSGGVPRQGGRTGTYAQR